MPNFSFFLWTIFNEVHCSGYKVVSHCCCHLHSLNDKSCWECLVLISFWLSLQKYLSGSLSIFESVFIAFEYPVNRHWDQRGGEVSVFFSCKNHWGQSWGACPISVKWAQFIWTSEGEGRKAVPYSLSVQQWHCDWLEGMPRPSNQVTGQVPHAWLEAVSQVTDR